MGPAYSREEATEHLVEEAIRAGQEVSEYQDAARLRGDQTNGKEQTGGSGDLERNSEAARAEGQRQLTNAIEAVGFAIGLVFLYFVWPPLLLLGLSILLIVWANVRGVR
jgi:hypothetical protein